ncbi:carbonic anhydrase [Astrocystis sublimbata]|nr:carbonic anhydrase [Astrocystis sublimbata]
MLSNATVKELFARSKNHPATHTPAPMMADVEVTDRPHTIIFCCADSRINPPMLFNLGFADAIVIRNAGCVIPRMIADLLILDQITDLREILIISHTDCGLTHVTDDFVRENLKEKNPGHKEEIDHISVGSFKDNAARVRSDAQYVRSHPLLRKELQENIHGAVYDIKTGVLSRVQL